MIHFDLSLIPGAVAPERFTRKICGIYFLLKDEKLVYVGQSVNIRARVTEHHHRGVDFDAYTYRLCRSEELDGLESYYIARFFPRIRNRDVQWNGPWLPVGSIAKRVLKHNSAPRNRDAAREKIREYIRTMHILDMNGFYRITDFADLM
jgi:hypothetical protein